MMRLLPLLLLLLTGCVAEPEPFSITVENETSDAWLLPANLGEPGFDVVLGHSVNNGFVNLFIELEPDPQDSCLPLCGSGDAVPEDCQDGRGAGDGGYALLPGDSVTREYSGEAFEYGSGNDCLEEGPTPRQLFARVCANVVASDPETGGPPAFLEESGPVDARPGGALCASHEVGEGETVVGFAELILQML